MWNAPVPIELKKLRCIESSKFGDARRLESSKLLSVWSENFEVILTRLDQDQEKL